MPKKGSLIIYFIVWMMIIPVYKMYLKISKYNNTYFFTSSVISIQYSNNLTYTFIKTKRFIFVIKRTI